MNIGFLTSEYPHPRLKRSAGIGSSIRNLAFGLANQGCKVTVFVVFQERDEILHDHEITIHSISRKGFSFGGWYLERKHIQKKVQVIIDDHEIQILEAPDWTGITAFMKFNIPVIIRMHGSDAYFCMLEGRTQKRKHFWFEKQALHSANYLVSVSSFTANITRKLFNLKGEIKVIYNGIDTRQFVPDHSAIKKDSLLYFGSLLRKKGLLELAKIFNLVIEAYPMAGLVLIGKDNIDAIEGRSTKELFLEELSLNARSKVSFLEEVSYDMIKTYIAQAEIVVLPSLAEAFPMTWLESLSMEKPMVTSSIGWAVELMIDGKTGLMGDPQNHKNFATLILKLLRDKDKAKTYGRNGRTHVVQNFSLDKIIDDNLKFYKSLIH